MEFLIMLAIYVIGALVLSLIFVPLNNNIEGKPPYEDFGASFLAQLLSLIAIGVVIHFLF